MASTLPFALSILAQAEPEMKNREQNVEIEDSADGNEWEDHGSVPHTCELVVRPECFMRTVCTTPWWVSDGQEAKTNGQNSRPRWWLLFRRQARQVPVPLDLYLALTTEPDKKLSLMASIYIASAR